MDPILDDEAWAVCWLIAAREQDFDIGKAFESRLEELLTVARAEAICRAAFRVGGK